MSLKFIRFELIKISVASFGIGVNIKLEKGERLAKGSRGLGLGELGLGSGKLSPSRQIVLASNRLRVKCHLAVVGIDVLTGYFACRYW